MVNAKEKSQMSSRFGRAPRLAGWLVALGALSLVASACGAATPLGATEADLSTARDQASQGAKVFSQECAHCHGDRGQGLAGASPILGPGALPEFPRDNGPSGVIDQQQLQIQVQARPAGAAWRDPFRNAQDLEDFTSAHMPKSRAAELKSEDYWAVVTFMVAAQGGHLPPGGIQAANAMTVPIPRR
jgi:Cytochrome C oxidase, cbb3-type, subunit III